MEKLNGKASEVHHLVQCSPHQLNEEPLARDRGGQKGKEKRHMHVCGQVLEMAGVFLRIAT